MEVAGVEHGRGVVLLRSPFELEPGTLAATFLENSQSQEPAGEPGSESQLGCPNVRPALFYKPWF